VRSTRSGEIDADATAGDHETVAAIAGRSSVTHVVEIDEAETTTAPRISIVDEDDLFDFAVLRKDILDLALVGFRVQVEDAQTLVLRRRFVGRVPRTHTGRRRRPATGERSWEFGAAPA